MRFQAPALAAAVSFLLLAACPEEPAPVVEPSPEEKIARAVKLEDERSLGDGELERLLGDLDGRVRVRAALALGRIGNARSAEALASLLSDSSAYVRSTAAFALGILEEPVAQPALDALAQALRDEDPLVRGRAAEALARHQKEAAADSIAAALEEHLPTGGEPYDWQESVVPSSAIELPHPDIRLSLFALGRLENASASARLVATEGGAPRFSWWPAAWTASRIPGDALLSVHLFYSGSPDPILRIYGARGLGAVSLDLVRSQLRQLLFDPTEKVRIEAIRAAARTGDSELLPDLLEHLELDTRYVQVEILGALSTLLGEQAVDPLIDRIGHESPWIRGLALEALARQDPDSFWLLLSGIGFDPDWRVRRSLARLFPKLAGERPKALLREMAEDPDPRVRIASLRSLASVDPDAAFGSGVRGLASDDPFERVAAAKVLASLGNAEAFAPMEQAFLVEGDPDPRVREGLLEALATLDFERARATIESATEDQSYYLRKAAASLLERNGLGPVAVRPRSSERSLEEYVAGLEAPYSPQAFIRTSRGTIEIELFIGDAPRTVASFMSLARDGFFSDQGFYQVVPNGSVAAGDPRGDGLGGPGFVLRSEINGRPILRGTVAMAEEKRDAGGSRFFITHLPEPGLEGRYTVFGRVSSGMEVVDALEPTDTIEEVTIWDGITPP